MKSKYEIVADQLRRTVLGLDPGQRLPSIRDIGRQTGVSQFTVQRAMDLLAEEGYVVRRSAMGVYSSRPQTAGVSGGEKAKPRVLLLAPGSWDTELIREVRATLAERGFLSHIHRYDLTGSPDRWLPRVRYEGIIFIGWCPPEMLHGLKRKSRIPFVAQGLQYANVRVDCACGNERLGGAIAARHLVELGHRRIAVLVNEPESPDNNERLAGFLEQSQSMGVAPRVLDCGLHWGEDNPGTAKRVMEAELAKGRLAFTALFTISEIGAMAALQVFYRHRIRVPDEVSVVGGDERPEAAHLSPAMTTIGFNLHDRAAALVETLERRFKGDKSGQITRMFEPYLIRRDSTSSPMHLEDKR